VISSLDGLRDWLRTAGWRATITWAAYKTQLAIGLRIPELLRITPGQALFPLQARTGVSSDIDVLWQVFRAEEYGCVRALSRPLFIIDLGANVGYSSIFFLSEFPESTVLAVEPDPGNFKLCTANLKPYGKRALLLCGAAWSRRCSLSLARGEGDGRDWAVQVREGDDSGQATVEAFDIPSLLSIANANEIDLLKVDIEKSEIELFGPSCADWLPRVKNICIELHGPDCDEVFFHALQGYDYKLSHSGELTFCQNLRPKVG